MQYLDRQSCCPPLLKVRETEQYTKQGNESHEESAPGPNVIIHIKEDDMNPKAFQDYYPDHQSYCYGCGRLNEYGLQIKSYWDGEETSCRFEPKPYHMSIPGWVYGGLIASLVDCHGTSTAAAYAYRAEGRDMGTEPYIRFVTGSLHVEYLRPTPLGLPLEIRAQAKEVKPRKVIVAARVLAQGEVCARGEVVAVRIKDPY
jgi:acyl-coenzyme A thioesterase PaaI-like protein